MSAACWAMTAAPSVRVVIILTGIGVRGMTHEASRPGGPSCSLVAGAAAPSLPRGGIAAAGRAEQRLLPLARPRGGGSAAAGRERDVPGAAAGSARRDRRCPALPAFVWPRRGPAPAQVRPRRPEPRPRRGGARPGPPAVPAHCCREPARSCQGECPARPGRAAGGARRRCQGPARPGRGAGAAGADNAGGPGGLLAVPGRGLRPHARGVGNAAGSGDASGAAGRSGGGSLLEDGGWLGRRYLQKEAVLEGFPWRRSELVMSPRELSFISSSGRPFKENHMSLFMPELRKTS